MCDYMETTSRVPGVDAKMVEDGAMTLALGKFWSKGRKAAALSDTLLVVPPTVVVVPTFGLEMMPENALSNLIRIGTSYAPRKTGGNASTAFDLNESGE